MQRHGVASAAWPPELPKGDDLAHYGYVTKEYFVSGTANGQPYKTSFTIR